MKRFIKILFLFIISLVVVLILLPFIFEDEIKLKVKEYLNERINAQVEFEDIHLSAIRRFPDFTLSIDKLDISNPKGFKHDSVFYAKSIILEMPIYSLWQTQKPIEVLKLEFNQPRLFVYLDKDGAANYDILKKTENEQNLSPLIFNLDNYEIHEGFLEYLDLQSGTNLQLKGLNHEGQGDFSQSKFDIQSKSALNQLKLVQNDVPLISNWGMKAEGSIKADLDQNKYSIANNSVWLNDLELLLDGYVQPTENETLIDLSFNTKKNQLREYLSLFPTIEKGLLAKAETKGSADLNGELKGKFDPKMGIYPSFFVRSGIENGFLKFPEYNIPLEAISGKLNIENPGNKLTDTEIELQNFTAKINQETIKFSARAKALQTDPFIESRLEGKLNLSDLSKAFPIPEIEQMKGKIQSKLYISTNKSDLESKNYDEIIFEGQMTGQDIDILRSNGEQYQIPSFGAEWTKEVLDIGALSLKQGNSDFFAEGRIMKPLDLLIPQREVDAQLKLNARRIDLNPFLVEANITDTLREVPSWLQRLKYVNLDWEAKVGELNYLDYDLLNNNGSGSLHNDHLEIEKFKGILSESDFQIEGWMNKVIAYSTDKDTISGELNLSSKLMNLSNLLNEENTDAQTESDYPRLPERMNLVVHSNAKELSYAGLTFGSIGGKIDLFDQVLDMKSFKANFLSGIIELDGQYSYQGVAQPKFALRTNLSKLAFSNTYKALPALKQLAPIFSFIEGVFNSTVIINGSLNKQLIPNLTDLTAAGYLETVNGKLKSFPHLDKLNEFFSVNMDDAWNLTNTKNWFDIENGTISLKEYKHIWKDIEFTIAGQHNLSKDIKYLIKAKVPRGKLNQSALGSQINKSIDSFVEKALSTGLIKSDAEQFILIDFQLKGNISNPKIIAVPKGIEGIEIVNPLEEIVQTQTEMIKDTVQTTIEQQKDTLQEKIEEEIEEVKDSLTTQIEETASDLTEQVEEKIEEMIDSNLQQSIPEVLPDSLKDKVEGAIEDLFGNKPKEEIKDKLKDFNPFKKKKKNN